MDTREYYLMNRSSKIAKLKFINDTFKIEEIYNANILKSIKDIDDWIKLRPCSAGRGKVLALAKLMQIDDSADYVEITKAISVTDTFWVDSREYPTTWEEINPYSNRISRIIADIAIDGISGYRGGNLASPSPQFKLGGSADKCVKRISGKEGIHLLKSCGEMRKAQEINVVRPYSEFFASKFIDFIGIQGNTVEYWVEEKHTLNGLIKPYSVCKIFTNEAVGLVEYKDSIYKDMEILELAKYLRDTGKTKDLYTLTDMLMIDSIILNIDRHSRNIGFLVDNESLSIIGVAPIYDNDCSLGSTISLCEKSFDDAFNEIKEYHLPKTNIGDYDEQALSVMNKWWYNKLKQLDGKVKLEKGSLTGISQNRVDFINYLINRRIKEILQITKQHYHLSD